MNSTHEPNTISNIKVLISIFGVCASVFLFTIGQGATNPILPLLVQNLGHTAAITGFVVGIFGAGRLITNLIDEFQISGDHSMRWDASDFSSGFYFITMKSNEFHSTQKVTLIK